MSTIYSTLQSALSGTTLTLQTTTFGPGGIQDVITKYFGTQVVITNVTLVQSGDNVSFANATITSMPLNSMTVSALFSPGSSDVVMQLNATPPAGWSFATGWPLLAGSWMQQIGIVNASFVLSSIAANSLNKGLNFNGSVIPGAGWAGVLWLINGQGSITMSGPVDQTGTVPGFSFTTALGSPVNIPPFLNNQVFSLRMRCVAISGTVKPPVLLSGTNDPVTPKFVPQIDFGLSATFQLTHDIALPIFVDLSTPQDTVSITADVTDIGMVAFTDFVSLFPGVNFGSVLPDQSTFDPGTAFTLRTLILTVRPDQRSIVSVDVIFGTTKSWSITNGISVGPVNLQFQIQPSSPQPLSVSLIGLVGFTGGSFQLGAYYPGFTFTGSLTEGSSINLTDVMNSLLPVQLKATLILDDLNFVVEPSTGNFSLITGLSGDWKIPVGIATIDLTNAWLNLDRQPGGTTGAIGIVGNLTVTGIEKPITFDGSWTLPGIFMMNAKFPAISLTSLASTISGTTLPAGVPDIGLTDGSVSIVLNNASGEYAFSLGATATVNGNSLGTGVFQVRKTAANYGYLVGFIVTQSWSPAQMWSNLSGIFGDLSFTNSGLIISTLPAGTAVALPGMKMPSAPATVSPGFTFFSTLSLTGNILEPVSHLFSDNVVFNLLAIVDTANPMNSRFQAILPSNQGNGSIQFKDITITLIPGAKSFSIAAAAVLTIQDDKIDLEGSGTVTMIPPSLAFTIEIENWIEPFGITGLTVTDFGLQLKVEVGLQFKVEEVVAISFLGSFLIGTAPRSFQLVIGGEMIDFEAPGAIIFELQDKDPANPLMLYDLIKQFTGLNLSSVPVLNAIGFTDLEFWVVDDPSGFKIGSYTFPPGIGVVADIFIYSWEAKFNIQVNASKGIIASGSINNPIKLGGIFSLTNSTGTKGPSGSIDTSGIISFDGTRMMRANTRLLRAPADTGPQPYLTLDGSVSFLGLSETIKAEVSKNSFDFHLSYDFLSIVKGDLNCSLIDDKNFSADATIGFDLDVTLGPYVVHNIELIPKITIHGPAASLTIDVAINPQVIASLGLRLKFSWASLPLFDLDVSVSLADIGNDLKNLYTELIKWLQNNVDKVFSNILSDVNKWIDAVKSVFTSLANDIDKVANVLANFFNTTAGDCAAFLHEMGYEFEAIVGAIVEFFKVGFSEAISIVEAIYHYCSLSNAFGLIESPTLPAISVRDLEFRLTETTKGQQLLLMWYAHDDEITYLLAPHPQLHGRFEFLRRSPRGANDLRLLIDTQLAVLTTIAPNASVQLKDHIDRSVPQLFGARRLNHSAFLETLKQ